MYKRKKKNGKKGQKCMQEILHVLNYEEILMKFPNLPTKELSLNCVLVHPNSRKTPLFL